MMFLAAVSSLLSPHAVVALLLSCACACLVGGAWLLWGPGWALMALALSLFVLAAALARGMNA